MRSKTLIFLFLSVFLLFGCTADELKAASAKDIGSCENGTEVVAALKTSENISIFGSWATYTLVADYIENNNVDLSIKTLGVPDTKINLKVNETKKINTGKGNVLIYAHSFKNTALFGRDYQVILKACKFAEPTPPSTFCNGTYYEGIATLINPYFENSTSCRGPNYVAFSKDNIYYPRDPTPTVAYFSINMTVAFPSPREILRTDSKEAGLISGPEDAFVGLNRNLKSSDGALNWTVVQFSQCYSDPINAIPIGDIVRIRYSVCMNSS